MDSKKRKIGFYYLEFSKPNNADLELKTELNQLFAFLNTRERENNKYDLNIQKFCILDSCTINGDIVNLIFESAIHSYRAPLMDRDTVSKRENPKTLKEGEILKTHFVLQYIDGDVLCIGEKFRGGIQIVDAVKYLNYFLSLYETERLYSFKHTIIAKDNIQEELNKMTRVVATTMYVDKQIIGSDALNYSNRIESLKTDVLISIKSNKNANMFDTARDILGKYLLGQSTQINKLRIEGKNDRGNDIMLDTSFMEKREYVTALLNTDTGEVDSESILSEMAVLL